MKNTFAALTGKKLPIILIISAIVLFAGCSKGSSGDSPSTPVTPATPATPTANVDTTVTTMQSQVAGRSVGVYCTYYGSALPNVSYVNYINYAFAELYVTKNVYKGFSLQGKESRFQSVVNLKKQNPSIKILVSFTNGIADTLVNPIDGGFSATCATDANRKAFASDCLAFIKKWGIDGIDIDWEFPGLGWSKAKYDLVNDTKNYTLMMKTLRDTLGSKYLLTFAGYVSDKRAVTGGYRYIDIAGVMPYVDYVNMMTYDFDSAPNYHNALQSSSSYWDCVRTAAAYIAAGAPVAKLRLGIPFYGRKAFSGTKSSISYKNLDKSTAIWSSTASVPYIPDAATKAVTYSYDNTKSIFRKGKWMLSIGVPGMFCWEIDQDDADNTLQKAMWNATMQ